MEGVAVLLLSVEAGNALLWVRRQVLDGNGRVIELIEALYRPEMYEYQISLVREGQLWDVTVETMNADFGSAL
jgi:hypothetical protein